MNKICTSIKQSQKLIELGVDVNTADMYYPNRIGIDNYTLPIEWKNGLPLLSQEIPAWSLSALLDILAKETHNIDEDGHIVLSSYKGNWWDLSPINCGSEEIKDSNSPLDAAFEMVCQLKENHKI